MSISDALPPKVAFALAFGALANARRLHAASNCLIEAGHFGPGMSLAISAREEIGKFVKALMIGLEQRSGEGAFTSVRNHKEKQAIGAAFGRLQFVFAASAESLKARGAIRATSLAALVHELTDTLQTKAETLQWPENSSIEEALAAAVSGVDERKRWRGLYVDPENAGKGWTILSPDSITHREALEEANLAGAFLTVLDITEDSLILDPEFDSIGIPDGEELRQVLSAFAAQQLLLNGPEASPTSR